MANEFIKDTAKALVFVSGMAFDGFAFEDLDLTGDEINEITKEIQKFCERGLKTLEKKYGDIPTTSTTDIIKHIMFE